MALEVSLEIGPKRKVVAQALDWPGWCRIGRDEDAAIAALVATAGRYAEVARRVGLEPAMGSPAVVVERVAGSATTDFGAIAGLVAADRAPLDGARKSRYLAMLGAAWGALDERLARVPETQLDVKPSVGRSPEEIRFHVLHTDLMHLSAFGPAFREPRREKIAIEEAGVRQRILEAFGALPLDSPFEPGRRYGFDWTPLFAVRRAAWHALDHAWELEDRAAAG